MVNDVTSTASDATSNLLGISYPLRRGRLVLSGMGYLFLLYAIGSVIFLIPAAIFVSEYGSMGWVAAAVLLSAVIGYVSYRAYRRTLDGILAEAEQVTADDAALTDTLAFLQSESAARGMETPTLYVHPSPIANALAVGRRGNGHIVIFDGLLSALDNEDELQAVVAHELSHIDNHDALAMVISTGIKSVIVRFWAWAGFAMRTAMYEWRGVALTPTEEQALKHKAEKRSALVCSPIGFMENSMSRHREYIADAEAADATNPEAMIGALESIGAADHDLDELDIPQTLCIHGEHDGILSGLRSDHPPIQKRIRYVRKTREDSTE